MIVLSSGHTYPAVAWYVSWSMRGYRGWDHETYRQWLYYGVSPGFGYVAEYGFGHEWWNFYEGFSDEYYYGYAPPVHAMKPVRFMDGGVIFFVSRQPRSGSWCLVGVYGCAEILQEPWDPGVTLWDLVPEECRREITGRTREALADKLWLWLRARKEYSTPMPVPMPLSLPDDVGISRFGRAAFKYIDDAERPKALLCKAI